MVLVVMTIFGNAMAAPEMAAPGMAASRMAAPWDGCFSDGCSLGWLLLTLVFAKLP